MRPTILCRAALSFMLAAAVMFTISGCPAPKSESKAEQAASQVPAGHNRFWKPGEAADGLQQFVDYLRMGSVEADPRPCLFVVILDDTGGEMIQWDEFVAKTCQVVDAMERGEAIVVLGIDYDSRDGSDVRLELTTLPDTSIPAALNEARSALREKVRAIGPRPVVKQGTDIVGALWQGAHLAKEKPSHRPVVIGFSNMEPQDTAARCLIPDDESSYGALASQIGSEITYPKGTEGAFFYVTTRKYDKLENYWSAVCNSTGIKVDPLPVE